MEFDDGELQTVKRWGKECEGWTCMAFLCQGDHKWIVCGTENGGASVWSAKTQEKAVAVEGVKSVRTVDISPDSIRFATGTGSPNNEASIWNILTGERLIGPLQHDSSVEGIKFSPNVTMVTASSRLTMRFPRIWPR
ncbi:hypothetical protein HD554DRAFT_698395 [Boletus coccyginus]|nr:hypothetical protein HD554DRAFT_698395 [Boletus coccyginus]